MINEVKFSKYEATKQCVKTIDLGDFIRCESFERGRINSNFV